MEKEFQPHLSLAYGLAPPTAGHIKASLAPTLTRPKATSLTTPFPDSSFGIVYSMRKGMFVCHIECIKNAVFKN